MFLTVEGQSSTRRYIYYFDSNNRLTKTTYNDNELRNSFEYDEKGNLVKILDGSYNECFEYDNNPGISKNINSPFWLLLLLSEDSHLDFSTSVVNNIIHTKDVSVSTNKNEYVSNIVYTYDKNGFAETFRYTGKGYYKTPYTIKYK